MTCNWGKQVDSALGCSRDCKDARYILHVMKGEMVGECVITAVKEDSSHILHVERRMVDKVSVRHLTFVAIPDRGEDQK
eukprot:scaffold86284_cov12-Tisochrysis_lutea.AAC.1